MWGVTWVCMCAGGGCRHAFCSSLPAWCVKHQTGTNAEYTTHKNVEENRAW
jgi:hypothetical protein